MLGTELISFRTGIQLAKS